MRVSGEGRAALQDGPFCPTRLLPEPGYDRPVDPNEPEGMSVASIQQLFTRAHQTLYIRSGGRIGHRLIGVPTLLLRTTGRRSGTTRTIAITYTSDGGDYVVVASNWGGERPPAWQLNIEADPRVEIQVARKRMAATALVIDRANPDFARLWKLANEGNRGSYDRYQAGTSRSIPVVLFRPDAPAPA